MKNVCEPIFLKGVMHEKIWGGNKFQTKFNLEIPSLKTGEYWTISCHSNGKSTITNEIFKGLTLEEVYLNHNYLFDNKGGQFPLLIKLIDANDKLSVQVHPDDNYCLKHEGELGKTECWYVLDAKENASIIYGNKAQTKDELIEMIDNKRWDDLLITVDAKKDDFFFLQAGTIHALLDGLLILEIQQASDTTYRVYDFDRVDEKGKQRDLHLTQAKDVTHQGKANNSTPKLIKINNNDVIELVKCKYFTVLKFEIYDTLQTYNKFAPYMLMTVIEGKGEITINNITYKLNLLDSFIIPSTVLSYTLSGNMTIIGAHI